MEDLIVLQKCIKQIFKLDRVNMREVEQKTGFEKTISLVNEKFELYIPSNTPGNYPELRIHYKEINMRARCKINLGDLWLTLRARTGSNGLPVFPEMYFFWWTEDYQGNKVMIDATHPHIQGGIPCLGGFDGRLHELYEKGAVLPFLLMIGKYLNTWYLDSSYWNINRMRRIMDTTPGSSGGVLVKGIEAQRVRDEIARVERNLTESQVVKIVKYSKKMKKSPYAIAESFMNIRWVCNDIIGRYMNKSSEWLEYSNLFERLSRFHLAEWKMGRTVGGHKASTGTKHYLSQAYDLLKMYLTRTSCIKYYTERVFKDDFKHFWKIYSENYETDDYKNVLAAFNSSDKFKYLMDIEHWKKDVADKSKIHMLFTDPNGKVNKELHTIQSCEVYTNLIKQAKYEAMMNYDKYLTKEIRRIKNAISTSEKSGTQTDLFAGGVQV